MVLAVRVRQQRLWPPAAGALPRTLPDCASDGWLRLGEIERLEQPADDGPGLLLELLVVGRPPPGPAQRAVADVDHDADLLAVQAAEDARLALLEGQRLGLPGQRGLQDDVAGVGPPDRGALGVLEAGALGPGLVVELDRRALTALRPDRPERAAPGP